MATDDIKYKEVINILKGLPEVNSPENFETELMRKINAGNFEKRLSLWDKIFLPSRLIPSAALAVTTVIILFVMNINSGEIDNPLLIEPRVREDVFANHTESISLENKYSISAPKQDMQDEVKEDRNKERTKSSSPEGFKSGNEISLIREDSNIADLDIDDLLSNRNSTGFLMKKSTTAASFIVKKGLNFRQVNLNEEEKKIVNQLKERIKSLLKSRKK